MTMTGDSEDALLAEIERVIGRMQKIQREIRASGQPVSMLEIGRLMALGREYAELTARLEAADESARDRRD
ncbi:MAG: hypothetical protein WCA32_07355 [Chromatiaceae bacterium]